MRNRNIVVLYLQQLILPNYLYFFTTMNFELEKALNLASQWADEAGQLTLKYYGKKVEILSKDDNSPVTIADKEAEILLRKRIEEAYPDHGIIGEEFGAKESKSGFTWILDPIDGTKSFIHTIPLYTNLIGLLYNDEPILGVINAPVVNEKVIAAKGLGSWYNDTKAQVRETKSIDDITFLITELKKNETEGHEEFFKEVHDRCRIMRTWGDAYGHMKIAAGQADLMFDPILSIWDAAALAPVVTEAGGVFSDVNGVETIHSGNGFSCSKSLKPEVISLLDKHSN